MTEIALQRAKIVFIYQKRDWFQSNSTKYYYFCSDVGFEIVLRLDFTSQSFQIGPLRIATEIKLKDFGT